MTTTAEVAIMPACDFCGREAAYDAWTTYGPWAFMCENDFKQYGPGRLGLGIGQRLVLAS